LRILDEGPICIQSSAKEQRMIARITMGFAAGALITGCQPRTAPEPRPLKPEGGPKGSVHVNYTGGTFTRRIQTRFRVESGSYVLVGHLGGDGQLRVLYPETPKSTGWVSGNKTVSLKPYAAVYDGSPHLFSFATASYRSVGARMDSYDGLGHGYVFMIASRHPIDFAALMDASGFEDLGIEDYERDRDPRYAVRSFADDIATGPYTLKFASSLGASPLDRAGCQTPWGFMGYRTAGLWWQDLGYSYFAYPGWSLLSGFALANFYGYGQQWCHGSHYAISTGIYRTRVVATVPTTTPAGPLTPRLQRPERRTLTDHERTTIVGRSSVGRGSATSARRAYDGRRSRPGDDWRPADRTSEPKRSSRENVGRSGHGSTPSRGQRPAERATRPQETQRTTTPASPSSTTGSAPSGGEKTTERPIPPR
jgi:hypothetical protein